MKSIAKTLEGIEQQLHELQRRPHDELADRVNDLYDLEEAERLARVVRVRNEKGSTR